MSVHADEGVSLGRNDEDEAEDGHVEEDAEDDSCVLGGDGAMAAGDGAGESGHCNT